MFVTVFLVQFYAKHRKHLPNYWKYSELKIKIEQSLKNSNLATLFAFFSILERLPAVFLTQYFAKNDLRDYRCHPTLLGADDRCFRRCLTVYERWLSSSSSSCLIFYHHLGRLCCNFPTINKTKLKPIPHKFIYYLCI